jgi:hypothetical protein
VIKPSLEGEETAEDLHAAGIRLPPVVTGENSAEEGESQARSVFHSSRGSNYPTNLIPELRTVFDLIPSHKRQQAWEVIDDYYTPELSKKNQFDILDKLDIQERPGGLTMAPWEVKPTQRSVNHVSNYPTDPRDTGPVTDIMDRTEGEQRWVNKLISTVEKFVEEDDTVGSEETTACRKKIGVIKRRLREQQRQQEQVVSVVQAEPPQKQQPMQVKGKGEGSMTVHARINQKLKLRYRRVSATLTRTFKRSLDLNTISEAVKGVPDGGWDFNNTTKTWEDRNKGKVHFRTEVVGRKIDKEEEADAKADSKADAKSPRT